MIVVGVDGSETAFGAAQVAAELARALGAKLHIVSAYRRSGKREIVGPGGDQWYDGDADLAVADARKTAVRLGGGDLEITTATSYGKPADILIQEAERLEARMIVVGNVRMQGPGRALGSVANSVVHHAPCDVHIVKTT
ncbi:MAG: universal stress protein [Acidimicrobiia bacterium]|nr:universal stress protein [Acidimicrobiia bacterium]